MGVSHIESMYGSGKLIAMKKTDPLKMDFRLKMGIFQPAMLVSEENAQAT